MSIILEKKSYDLLKKMTDSSGYFYHGRGCRCGCNKLLKEFTERQLLTIQHFFKKDDLIITHSIKKDDILGVVKYVEISHEDMQHLPKRKAGIL